MHPQLREALLRRGLSESQRASLDALAAATAAGLTSNVKRLGNARSDDASADQWHEWSLGELRERSGSNARELAMHEDVIDGLGGMSVDDCKKEAIALRPRHQQFLAFRDLVEANTEPIVQWLTQVATGDAASFSTVAAHYESLTRAFELPIAESIEALQGDDWVLATLDWAIEEGEDAVRRYMNLGAGPDRTMFDVVAELLEEIGEEARERSEMATYLYSAFARTPMLRAEADVLPGIATWVGDTLRHSPYVNRLQALLGIEVDDELLLDLDSRNPGWLPPWRQADVPDRQPQPDRLDDPGAEVTQPISLEW
jgi:hypothetical protein